jgi:hypothetical protein
MGAHRLRVIDADDLAPCRPLGEFADRDTRSEPDFEDAIRGLHVEQRHGPGVALSVRRPKRHLPSREAPSQPAGMVELRDGPLDDESRKPAADAHRM